MAKLLPALLVLVAALGLASAFQAPMTMSFRHSSPASFSTSRIQLRKVSPLVWRTTVARKGTLLPNGELELTNEECEKLKMPMNSVIPVENVAQFQQMLQDIDDEAVRKLARQIGTNPAEEPYPGYYDDVKRLGLEGKDLTASSSNPGGMYGPDGKPYAPWMVGKIAENVPKRATKQMTDDERQYNLASRGQELSGVGLIAQLLGDEVKLSWIVEGEQNSKGYIVSKRPGGSEDVAFQPVADYQTPGAYLEAGRLAGKYSFVDGSVKPGVWVYRVQEEDIDGTKTSLSQTIIDVPSNEDKIKTLVAAAFLGTVLTALTVTSLNVDPQYGLTGKDSPSKPTVDDVRPAPAKK